MWTAAILAGGRARRFEGRDKSALLVEGRTILERQLDALAPLTDDILFVGGDATKGLGTPAPLFRPIPDRIPGSGPLGGLDAALASARGDAVMLLACDMPFVTTPLIQHLLTLTGEADVAVPRSVRGYHPLCAAYTPACAEPIARRLAEGRLKMIEVFEDVRVRVVTAGELEVFGDPDRLLANINTPAEYASLEALHGHKL